MSWSLIKTTKWLGIFAFTFLCLHFKIAPAKAVPGEVSSTLPSDAISRLILTRPGGNGMDAPKQRIYAYVPLSTNTVSITIQSACDADTYDNGSSNKSLYVFKGIINLTSSQVSSGRAIIYTGASLKAIDSTLGSANQWGIECTSGSNLDIVLTLSNDNNWYPQIPLHDSSGATRTLKVLEFSAQTFTLSNSYYANQFKYIANTAGVLLGYSRESTNPGYTTSKYTGISYIDPHRGWSWSTTIAFAQQCGTGSKDDYIYFFDTDHKLLGDAVSPYWQDTSNPMRWEVRRYKRGETDPNKYTVVGSGILKGENNQPDKSDLINFNSDYAYTLALSGINYTNSLQVALPFHQIYEKDVCAYNRPDVSCEFVTPGQVVPVGDNYYPVVRVNNANIAGASPINASVNISVDTSPAQARNVPLSGPIGVNASATFGVENPDTTANDTTYDSNPNTPIVVNTPARRNVTATVSWAAITTTHIGTINCQATTVDFVYQPYFKVLGGDIVSFGTDVTGRNQRGVTFSPAAPCAASANTGQCGAGAETAIQSNGNVTGVTSAYKRAAVATASLKRLTFANTSGTWGGAFNASPPPVLNFTIPASAGAFPGLAGVANNTVREYVNSGSSFAGGTVATGARVTVYVNGNVRITGNVVYSGSGSYSVSTAVPHFRLVAKGDIYVSSGVSRLDGEYIAEGSLYTCHNAGWATPIASATANFYTSCNNSLTVNGTLVGDNIKLTRTLGHYRNAATNDGSWCGAAYCGGGNIAEVVQFTPELFLSRPAPSRENSPTSGKYNSITSLPPLF